MCLPCSPFHCSWRGSPKSFARWIVSINRSRMMKVSPESAAALIARLLKQRGVKRVFALCGGHIMPIWMRLDAEGIRIVDVRDERAAVHMAQAHAEVTGELG